MNNTLFDAIRVAHNSELYDSGGDGVKKVAEICSQNKKIVIVDEAIWFHNGHKRLKNVQKLKEDGWLLIPPYRRRNTVINSRQ